MKILPLFLYFLLIHPLVFLLLLSDLYFHPILPSLFPPFLEILTTLSPFTSLFIFSDHSNTPLQSSRFPFSFLLQITHTHILITAIIRNVSIPKRNRLSEKDSNSEKTGNKLLTIQFHPLFHSSFLFTFSLRHSFSNCLFLFLSLSLVSFGQIF